MHFNGCNLEAKNEGRIPIVVFVLIQYESLSHFRSLLIFVILLKTKSITFSIPRKKTISIPILAIF